VGVTGSSTEVVYVTAPVEELEPDYDRPVTNAELVDALEARTRRVRDDELVDVDLRGDDAFGL
jgi:hypothetical protein